MSGLIHVEHQLGFSSSKIIRTKQEFEQLALGHGVLIEDYLTNNGIFSKMKFVDHIHQHNQQIHYCGANAHHKNAITERAICTVSELAQALLLHASTHWPDGIDGALRPLAVDHAVHLYNTLPNQHGVCPLDLFSGTTIPRHKLQDLHVWGCPLYVLDPTLHQGKKLPRWQPRSRRGVFLGYSRHHSSDVPLVLNLQTGSNSPQFHLVFDDSFSTVTSTADDLVPPELWTAANIESCLYRIPVEPDDSFSRFLPDDWLTPSKLEEKHCNEHHCSRIWSTFAPEAVPPLSVPPAVPPTDAALPTSVTPSSSLPGSLPDPMVPPSPPTLNTLDCTSPATLVSPVSSPLTGSSPPATDSPPTTTALPSLHRSSRSTKGTFKSTKYIDEVYHYSFTTNGVSRQNHELAYQADLHTDLDTGDHIVPFLISNSKDFFRA